MEKGTITYKDKCWVYILKSTDDALSIGIAGDLKQRLENSKKEMHQSTLIYYRCFPDTLSALGFKLLLQQLSLTSLKLLIRDINPALINLNDHIDLE